MSPNGRGFTHVPSMQHDYEHRDEDQKAQERADRRSVLRSLLTFAQTRELTGLQTVELTEMLGIEAQLDELAGDDPKRQRRLADLRRQLGFSEDELEDREDGNIA